MRRHLLIASVLVLVASCSSGSDSTDTTPPATAPPSTVAATEPPATEPPATASPVTEPASTEPPTTAPPAPSGPVADVSEEITGANPPFLGTAGSRPLADVGYVEEEFVAAGEATSYRPVGDLTADGRWTFEPADTASYRTRVLVRRPADPANASGTVVIEWLNVSGGLDAAPDFTFLRDDIVRNGDVWVGLSAQLLGVEGGPVLVGVEGAGGAQGQGLKRLDPERYDTLDHPGDGFSFDMLTQVARAVRAGGDLLGGIQPTTVVAAGESQSAIALTTYINGVQPLTGAFDGFFVHSRASVPLPLVEPGEFADLAAGFAERPTIIREDTDVPVMMVQAEGDVVGILNSLAVRQDDTELFRLWEVAGTAHADRWLIGPQIADGLDCGAPINDGPMHVVVKAAYRSLVRWITEGTPPPEAPRLEIADGQIVRNADGIAQGGIRTPPVDVYVEVLSGAPGPNPSTICLLLGTTTPLPPARLAELQSNRETYLARFESAARAAVDAGFVLEDDLDALLAFAKPDLVG